MTVGTGRGAPPARGKGWAARHRNQLAGAGAGLVVLAGGVLALVPHGQPAPPHTVAADCGLVRCSATLPATAPASPAPRGTGRPGKSPGTGRHRASGQPSTPAAGQSAPATAGPAPSPVPVPVPVPSVAPTTPPPPPPPPRPLTVSYTVVQSQSSHWGTRFVGRFTLVNHTVSDIAGWQLQAGLPGDRVRWVSTSADGWPWYRDWYARLDSVVVSGPHSSEAVPAHGSMVLYFSAEGQGTGMSSCTINGSAC